MMGEWDMVQTNHRVALGPDGEFLRFTIIHIIIK